MSVFLPPHYCSPSFVLSCLPGASYYGRTFSIHLCLMVCLDLGLELWPLLGLERAEQHTVPRAEIRQAEWLIHGVLPQAERAFSIQGLAHIQQLNSRRLYVNIIYVLMDTN